MTIIEALKQKASNEDGRNEVQINNKLYNLAINIASMSKEHLKLIIQQLPEYDLHDVLHSEKVLMNMEELMTNEIIDKLSSYELFLLYLSAYVHDCAMALPEWESKLLKLSEGTEGYTKEDISNSLMGDCKSPLKLSEAIRVVKDRKLYLYGDFENIKEFPFIQKGEDKFQRDLAERLIQYQEFRNGFSSELKELVAEGNKLKYLEYSEFIRHEFIRSTHTIRIEKYINNLAPIFIESLGGAWGASLAKDLSKICRSHGEEFDYVLKLESQTSYFGSDTANLQFVSIMLRLADILHFSYDRAPKSLFTEKLIESKVSIEHWKVKFQGLNYILSETNSDEKINIKYMAYCDDPGSYYFLQDYMDWIDNEINNYYRFIHRLEYSINTKELVKKYKLKIVDKVDRSQIKYNEEKFIPVINMCFSLNQKKILELLMGVGLYKNKYLCLRELYQNALDACRTMLTTLQNYDTHTKGHIEFGIGNDVIDGKLKKYLYCLDNGIGMTREIVENYLLKIGNSYYNSQEFKRKSVRLGESFKPVSQFGIGILSCFMIGEKIEITTMPMEERDCNTALRFSIDGPHEHFYYLTPDEIDLENIGSHGTLVKIYLKNNENINNDYIDQLPLIINGKNNRILQEKYPEIYQKWKQNLYKILSDSIGIFNEVIDVVVRFSNNEVRNIIQWNIPFNTYIHEIKKEDLKLLYSDYKYLSDGYNPFQDYMNFKDYIISRPMHIVFEGIEYYFLLNLPKINAPFKDYRILEFPKSLFGNSNSVLIDGVYVSSTNSIFDTITDDKNDIYRNGIINFVGQDRPQLSVDRNSITFISDAIKKRLTLLNEKILEAIVNEVSSHIKQYQLKIDSYESKMIWDYIFAKFKRLSNELIKYILMSPEVDIIVEDLSNSLSNSVTVSEYVALNEVVMNNANFKELGPMSKIIVLGKLIDANSIDVKDLNVIVKSDKFYQVNLPNKRLSDFGILPVAICADKWCGYYEEYDLVSNIWPIIPKKLFDNLKCEFDIREMNGRAKMTSECSNSLAAIANIDPVLVNAKYGIFSYRDHSLWKRDVDLIYKFENPCNDFWMFEINDHGRRFNDTEDYFVYTFISPRKLNEKEKVSMEYCMEEDIEYCEGVTNGWSILFLGRTNEKIIVPGIKSRNEVVKMISQRFWSKNKDKQFYFLDGTPVQ